MESEQSLSSYSSYFNDRNIPQGSKTKYEYEFNKFRKFIEVNSPGDQTITEKNIENYLAYCRITQNSSAASLKTYVSIIKAFCNKNNVVFTARFWKSLYRFIKEDTKGEIVKKAPMFEKVDAMRWFNEAPEATSVQIQKKVCFIVAFSGALRVSESHKLKKKDIFLTNSKNEIEIFIKDSKNKKSRSFLITNLDIFKLN